MTTKKQAKQETVTLEKPFKYAFRGLDVVSFAPGKYTVVDEYDPESTDTIPLEVAAAIPE